VGLNGRLTAGCDLLRRVTVEVCALPDVVAVGPLLHTNGGERATSHEQTAGLHESNGDVYFSVRRVFGVALEKKSRELEAEGIELRGVRYGSGFISNPERRGVIDIRSRLPRKEFRRVANYLKELEEDGKAHRIVTDGKADSCGTMQNYYRAISDNSNDS